MTTHVKRLTVLPLVVFASACTPSLHDTIARGELERAATLLADDPALLESRSFDDKTPLFYAVVNARPDAVEWLLQQGADMHARDESGLTPLHVAAALNRRPEGRHLMRAGADTNARDAFGNTPLHAAALHGSARVLNDLLRARADVSVENDRGLTARALAAEYGQQGTEARLAMLDGGGE